MTSKRLTSFASYGVRGVRWTCRLILYPVGMALLILGTPLQAVGQNIEPPPQCNVIASTEVWESGSRAYGRVQAIMSCYGDPPHYPHSMTATIDPVGGPPVLTGPHEGSTTFWQFYSDTTSIDRAIWRPECMVGHVDGVASLPGKWHDSDRECE